MANRALFPCWSSFSPQCLPACGRAGDGSFSKSRYFSGNDLAPQGFGGSFRILAIEQVQIIHSDTCHMAGVFCFDLKYSSVSGVRFGSGWGFFL